MLGMISSRWNVRARRAAQTALFLGTLGALALPAFAQGNYGRRDDDHRNDQRGNNQRGNDQLLFEWRGRVDKEMRVSMQGKRTLSTRVGDKETSNGRFSSVGVLPRVEAPVRVETVEGRGTVDIVQQPNAKNGYTTIIRIRDTASGASDYRIRVYTTADTRRNDDRGRDNRNRNGYRSW